MDHYTAAAGPTGDAAHAKALAHNPQYQHQSGAALPASTSSLPLSTVEAVAAAPAGATTGPVSAAGFASGPPCAAVTAEKAIGEARVDTSFLSALQPNMREM